MTPEQLKQRTKKFGIRIIKVVEKLPTRLAPQTVGKQLLRCGTSVGANYRAACRARSDAEFRAKLGICEEEADESIYWLEIIVELGYIQATLLNDLINEANQLFANNCFINPNFTPKAKQPNPQSEIRNPKSSTSEARRTCPMNL